MKQILAEIQHLVEDSDYLFATITACFLKAQF